MMRFADPLTIAFVALCIVAILCDLRLRRIPNRLILIGLALPMPWLLLDGQALLGITPGACIAGALLGFACLLPAYALRKMGGGDVKFFAVLGFWLGPAALVSVFVVGSVIAAVQALATLAGNHPLLHGQRANPSAPPPPQHRTATLLHGWRFAGRGIPYAAWLAIGALHWLLRQPGQA